VRAITTVTTVYSFDELSEESQQKALEELWDLNVDYDWWDSTYEDASRIGLKIDGFDCGNRNSINGELAESLLDCCKLIRKHHGKECETFKAAAEYLDAYIQAFKEWLPLQDHGDEYYTNGWNNVDWLKDFEGREEAEEVTNDFRKALLEDYLSMLRREYDYQTSEEAIKETIYASEYEFTEDGHLS
jgi:hypothetical protein